MQIISDKAKKHVRRMSIMEQARSGIRNKRRRQKPCCLLRYTCFHRFLIAIFGARFEVHHDHMHVLAYHLTAKERCSTMLNAILFFFVVPLICVCSLWLIPLPSLRIKAIDNGESTFNISGVLYSKDTAPMNVSEQAVYFWVTLPIVLFLYR